MPATNTSVQHIPVTLVAGTVHQTAFCPYNPTRNYLKIQNKGVNSAFVRFGAPCGDGSQSLILGGGSEFEWDTMVPIESINLRSLLGTAINILEGREP